MTLATQPDVPRHVDERAARLVAGMSALLGATILASDLHWLTLLLVYEFGARVLTGPRLSVMSRLATRVLVPALGLAPRLVPAPPKRFAQAIGLGVSLGALVSWPVLGLAPVGQILLAVLLASAFLEAAAGFCAGCFLFAQLMRLGWIPQATCEECRVAPPTASGQFGRESMGRC